MGPAHAAPKAAVRIALRLFTRPAPGCGGKRFRGDAGAAARWHGIGGGPSTRAPADAARVRTAIEASGVRAEPTGRKLTRQCYVVWSARSTRVACRPSK